MCLLKHHNSEADEDADVFEKSLEQMFRFGLARPGQAKTELWFWSQRDVRHKLHGHPVRAKHWFGSDTEGHWSHMKFLPITKPA